MQEIFSLNEMYARYTGGRLEREKLESFIFKNTLQDFCQRYLMHWRSDDRADFISWVYPRIRTAVDSYTDTGSSFAAYLGTAVHWAAREYRAQITESRNAEYAAWAVRVPELFVHENETVYSAEGESVEAGTAEPPAAVAGTEVLKNPRQILFLILKCYLFLSDEFLARAAPQVGLSPEELKALVDRMRRLRLKHDDDLRSMRERLYCQYYRCIMYEKRLTSMPDESHIAIRIRIRLEKARKRLANMRKRLESLRPGASNRQIADILGLSKGTVDSALHNLKTRWNNDPDSVILN